jgi:methylated-DNA-protein-cysteine methyltransferase related protein
MVLSESKTESTSKTQSTTQQPLYDAIYSLVKQIPEGQVATYGQIAEMLGLYGRARQVGYALFQVAPGSDIPWHRVVNAQGKISRSPMRQGNDDLQRILLEREGIGFDTQEKLNLSRYRWNLVVSAQK